MVTLRAYSNTITLDGFLLHSHILCRHQRDHNSLLMHGVMMGSEEAGDGVSTNTNTHASALTS